MSLNTVPCTGQPHNIESFSQHVTVSELRNPEITCISSFFNLG